MRGLLCEFLLLLTFISRTLSLDNRGYAAQYASAYDYDYDWYGPFQYPLDNPLDRYPRLLFSKGSSSHPLTEFGKIHFIKKGYVSKGHSTHEPGYGYGWGTYGDDHHEDSHGHSKGHGGTGWGQYHVPQHYYGSSHHHKEPEKKGWFSFPKKSFGIHVKGGVGFSFGGKKGGGNSATHHLGPPTTHPQRGWGSYHGYGSGWNGWGPQRHSEGRHHYRTGLPVQSKPNDSEDKGRSLEVIDSDDVNNESSSKENGLGGDAVRELELPYFSRADLQLDHAPNNYYTMNGYYDDDHITDEPVLWME